MMTKTTEMIISTDMVIPIVNSVLLLLEEFWGFYEGFYGGFMGVLWGFLWGFL